MMMRVLALTLAVAQLLLLISFTNADAVYDLWTKGQPALDTQLAKSTTCTKDKLQVRKEW